MSAAIVGGCQCGAVRYRVTARLRNPHICHCRMCQKAFGSYFAPLAAVQRQALEWTRGEPALYRSSEAAERGFCADCGTPLTFAYVDQAMICVSLGSLDDPAAVAPRRAYGLESKLPFFAELGALPGTRTEEGRTPEEMKRLTPLARPD
jgi:hypothetical protein